MDTKTKKTFPQDFKLNSSQQSNKRGNRASFIPHLPGFVLKVIASRLLNLSSDFSEKREKSLESNSENLTFNFQLNSHNYKFQIIDYAKHFKNNLLN